MDPKITTFSGEKKDVSKIDVESDNERAGIDNMSDDSIDTDRLMTELLRYYCGNVNCLLSTFVLVLCIFLSGICLFYAIGQVQVLWEFPFPEIPVPIPVL